MNFKTEYPSKTGAAEFTLEFTMHYQMYCTDLVTTNHTTTVRLEKQFVPLPNSLPYPDLPLPQNSLSSSLVLMVFGLVWFFPGQGFSV